LERENAENDANCENEGTAQNPRARRSIHELSFELPQARTRAGTDRHEIVKQTPLVATKIVEGPQSCGLSEQLRFSD
jgi:hypothetical protein